MLEHFKQQKGNHQWQGEQWNNIEEYEEISYEKIFHEATTL